MQNAIDLSMANVGDTDFVASLNGVPVGGKVEKNGDQTVLVLATATADLPKGTKMLFTEGRPLPWSGRHGTVMVLEEGEMMH
jgi:hypothetical protein